MPFPNTSPIALTPTALPPRPATAADSPTAENESPDIPYSKMQVHLHPIHQNG